MARRRRCRAALRDVSLLGVETLLHDLAVGADGDLGLDAGVRQRHAEVRHERVDGERGEQDDAEVGALRFGAPLPLESAGEQRQTATPFATRIWRRAPIERASRISDVLRKTSYVSSTAEISDR